MEKGGTAYDGPPTANGSEVPMRSKGTPGLKLRHSRGCVSRQQLDRAPEDRACDCTPTVEASVYSKRDGRRFTKSFTGKRALTEAKIWRTQALAAMQQGKLRAPSRETLASAAADFLDGAEKGRIQTSRRPRHKYAPATIRGYRRDLETYVLPELGNWKLSAITADDIQGLIVEPLNERGLSGQKVRNVLVPIQAIYHHNRRRVPINPTRDLDLPEGSQGRKRAAGPREAAELLAPLGDDLALWATAFYGGLRRGELRALHVSNVTGLDGAGPAHIHVASSWDDVEGEKDPKSRSGERDVPVPETLRVILADHVERTGRSGNDLLLGRTASVPFSPTLVRRRAERAWAAAAVGRFLRRESSTIELVPIGLHECRHSYASMLDAAGISGSRAKRYLGHSRPGVTEEYRHVLAGQLADDAARLDAYLTGSASGKVVSLRESNAA